MALRALRYPLGFYGDRVCTGRGKKKGGRGKRDSKSQSAMGDFVAGLPPACQGAKGGGSDEKWEFNKR